jgi:hypothetical protein
VNDVEHLYRVRVRWDEGSKTWWTDGEDIPGLRCQADSFDELIETVLETRPGAVARQWVRAAR